jgi:hypothetical protein
MRTGSPWISVGLQKKGGISQRSERKYMDKDNVYTPQKPLDIAGYGVKERESKLFTVDDLLEPSSDRLGIGNT